MLYCWCSTVCHCCLLTETRFYLLQTRGASVSEQAHHFVYVDNPLPHKTSRLPEYLLDHPRPLLREEHAVKVTIRLLHAVNDPLRELLESLEVQIRRLLVGILSITTSPCTACPLCRQRSLWFSNRWGVMNPLVTTHI